MHSARCATAEFQHAIAYSDDGLQASILLLTAPGEENLLLQSTDPVGSA
jgi:hypothetical protein